MGRFPLDIPRVHSELIVPSLMIEDKPIVLMGETFDVLVKKKLYDVVLLRIQSEKVFHLDAYPFSLF